MPLSHRGTERIETERLILRRFTEDDTESIFENWTKDPDVAKYLSWTEHANIETTRDVLQKWIESYTSAYSYEWGIALKQNGTLVGSIGLPRLEESATIAEVGYCIGKEYWNRGIVTEALARVIAFCFQEIGFKSVMAKHHVDNPASGRVMQKCGMKYVGCKPITMVHKDNTLMMCDFFMITREEWAQKNSLDPNKPAS